MRFGRRALLAGLAGLAMPSPTEARLALRAAASGARDRLATRHDAILGLAGDGNGNTTVPGTGLIPFRTLTGGRVLLAHNPSGRAWTQGELVEAIPLDDRAPLGYRVPGRRAPVLFAQLIWSDGTEYVDSRRYDEPWMIHASDGRMTPIGTHRFPPFVRESDKTAVVGNWLPLTNTNLDISNLYRAQDGIFSWRSRLLELSDADGGIVYPFVQYSAENGWLRFEPNLRAIGISSPSDNSRGEALDINDAGDAVYVDTLNTRKAIWRNSFNLIGGSPLLLSTQIYPDSMYTALPPDGTRWIDAIQAGVGSAGQSTYGVQQQQRIAPTPNYANIFAADVILSGFGDGIASNYFRVHPFTATTYSSYIATWRADGGVYWLRNDFDSTGPTNTYRLDFSVDEVNWALVNTFVDTGLAGTIFGPDGAVIPFHSGLFGYRATSGLTGTGNFYGAINYYGPATLSGDAMHTIRHVRVTAAGASETAILSVAIPVGSAGGITGMVVAGGNLYVAIGANRSVYTNAHISPGIYEINTTNYGVRQVCGVPPGTSVGGWKSIWGDRRSTP